MDSLNSVAVLTEQPALQANQKLKKRLQRNIPLIVMFTPALLYFVLFRYIPIGGLIIAFKNYNFHDGILHSPWAGLDNYKLLINNPNTLNVIRNTLIISLLSIIIGFPFPIILAILLNEVRVTIFKRSIQTLVYLPHFLNWVIVGGFVTLIFNQSHGIANTLVKVINNGHAIPFLYQKLTWLTIFLGAGVWKEVGFGAIIYLAALSSIDPSLYESASIDGANKIRQIWHITLPGITPIIILMLVLSMDSLLSVGFNQIYNLANPSVGDIADVISTWTYRVGLQRAQFSLTTALGLFRSMIGLILVLIANKIATKFQRGLW